MTVSSPQQKRKFWSRRVGRPLRRARSAALDVPLARVRIDLDETALGQANPREWFNDLSHDQEIWLEIGFGNGEHLVQQAVDNPDVGVIGCEPFINGVSAMLVDMQKQNADNIRVWPDDARVLLRCLKPNSLSRVFVLFADPWPKMRHHKRRFIEQGTLEMIAKVLRPDGEMRLATDHSELAKWMKRHVDTSQLFETVRDETHTFPPISDTQDIEMIEMPPNWPKDWVFTRYQQKAKAGHTVWLGDYAAKP